MRPIYQFAPRVPAPARPSLHRRASGVWLAAGLACLLPLRAARANDEVPAPPQAQPIVLQGGTIHPVSGPDIPDGQLIFDHGKITAVGQHLTLPADAEVIDVAGKHVYPGLIAAHSVLGLSEVPAVRATLDYAEPGAINPNVIAGTAINPDSELLPVARANGVLTALSVPTTADGLISGTSTLISLDGWTAGSMTVKARVGLHVFWPVMRIERDPRFPKPPEDQQKDLAARLRQLKEAFAAARAYGKALDAAGAAASSQPSGGEHPASAAVAKPATDLRLAAMLPALRGEMPVFVHADEIQQIEAAVQWADAEKLRLVIVGGQDAWRVAKLLKDHDAAVIVGAIHSLPMRRWEAFDTPFTNPAKLQAAGVRFCIADDGTDFDAPHERNLPYQAAQAAAHGLPKNEALASVTLYPAQILGVADRLGSLEPGKDATLIVTNGDPLEIMTQVEMAFIGGRAVDLSNRQTRLRDKYQQKFRH